MIVSSDRGRPEEVRRHGIKLRKPVCEILFHKSLVEIASIFKFKMATAEKKDFYPSEVNLERWGKEGVKERVDAGIAVSQHVRPNLEMFSKMYIK